MADLLNFDFGEHLFFFLVLLRISGIFFFAPVFGSNNVSPTVRIGFSFIVALIVFNIAPVSDLRLVGFSEWEVLVLCLKEFALGFLIGLIPQIIFTAIEFSGTLIGNMMGVSIVNLIDPQSDSQASLVGSFKNALALMLFLAVDAHYMVIHAVFESFNAIPLQGIDPKVGFFEQMVRYSGKIFTLGIKIGAPLVILLFFINVIMGFLARSIPNLNVFMIEFPLSLLVGLTALMLGIPAMVGLLVGIFEQTGKDLLVLIRSLSP